MSSLWWRLSGRGAGISLNLEEHPMKFVDIKNKIKTFISGNFRNYELQDDDDIFSLGFVNSLFAMQLVMFVEKEFRLKVHDDDLLIDNFRTVNAVMDLVTKKLGIVAVPA
jgi:methoxymalonate biosynthesis acyl carrier protein